MLGLSKEKRNEIEQEVSNITRRLGLRYPEDGLIKIVKALGIDVYTSDFEDKSVRYFSCYDESTKESRIYINEDQDSTSKTFFLAHALGHFVLHPKQKKRIGRVHSESERKEDIAEEAEADYFAMSILVPERRLEEYLKRTKDYEEIASYLGVSRPVVEDRVEWMEMQRV